MSTNALVITGIGMASSLGPAIGACAAARAGVTRTAPLDLVVGGPDTEVPLPVTGHPCPWVEGFTGVGRLVALLNLAIEDLVGGTSLPPGQLPLLLEAPPVEERPGLQEQLDEEWEKVPGDLEGRLGEGLSLTQGSSGRGWALQVTQRGHAGGLALLSAAQELLRSGRHEACVIGGVDSLMDLLTQEWLYATRQLKHPNHPVGLMPGEGAAVVLIERAAHARKRGARVLAEVGPVSLQDEEYSFSDEGVIPHGRALASAIRDVVRAPPLRARNVSVILHDLNGQVVRAMEWGNTLIHLAGELEMLRETRRWMPAASFGDVGSASGAFSLCMATQAFARGYAQGTEVLLCNSSESGLRSAAILAEPRD
ncbi:beta-ketoacyl synthase N-terminal-like domain-containing protein [Corallococcus terminator]|uniref:Uncharacterized protein n=1 Tax=Corallococcus terminator TaxID=2316733 RepID=A0A3A8J7W8_9BACT|nr:beta-ketoacyl synthase N-terminal-like domain-containing protein [Corallococcus terminator]RKG91138.1 hypothetical protein D7V88_10035 [Corallococcus terminator]